MQIKEQSQELLTYIFPAAFQIPLQFENTPSPSLLSSISLSDLAEDEATRNERMNDAVQVLCKYLFGTYAVCQQFCVQFITMLSTIPENAIYALVVKELQNRTEFQKADRVLYPNQIRFRIHSIPNEIVSFRLLKCA